MLYLFICLVSLLVCIVSAHYMRLSVGWAVLFGLLLSPASGIAYIYMAASGDRKPWRVALVGLGLALVLISLMLAALGMFNQAPQSASTFNTNNVDVSIAAILAPTSTRQSSDTSGISQVSQQSPSTNSPTENTTNEFTTYLVECGQRIDSISDCTKPYGGYSTFTSRIDLDTGTVYMTSPISPKDKTLTDYVLQPNPYCKVINADSYTCNHPNGVVDGLNNGIPFPYYTYIPSVNTAYIPNITVFELSEAEWLQLPATLKQP